MSVQSCILTIATVTVQTGLVTALCATLDLICFFASVSNTISAQPCNLLSMKQPTALHTAFNEPMAQLYANSLMSSLNSRSGWGYGGGIMETPSNGFHSSNSIRFASAAESRAVVTAGHASIISGQKVSVHMSRHIPPYSYFSEYQAYQSDQ